MLKEINGDSLAAFPPGIPTVGPLPGGGAPDFIAMMNYLDFDIAEENVAPPETRRYRGCWFVEQPLSLSDPKLTSGLYLLSEIQPVYGFVTDELSLWIAPAFGKTTEFDAVHLTPGFGIDDNTGFEREWTLEVGMRYFF